MEVTKMSNLQFQEPAMDVPLRLRSFPGRNIDQMPLLLSGKDKEGEVVDVVRTPTTVKQLLYDRVHGTHENDRTLLRDNHVDTGVALIGDPNGSGEAIIGLYADQIVQELVRSLNPESPLKAGSLPVNTDQYQAVKKGAFVFSPDVANALRSNAYSEQKTREGFWDYVAEGDASLVRENLALVQEVKGGSMRDRMGLFLTSHPGLRLLCVGSVGLKSSVAGGYLDLGLNNGGGRIVGLAAEPLGARGNCIPNSKSIADNVHNYLTSRTMAEGVTKKGLLKAVQDCYK